MRAAAARYHLSTDHYILLFIHRLVISIPTEDITASTRSACNMHRGASKRI